VIPPDWKLNYPDAGLVAARAAIAVTSEGATTTAPVSSRTILAGTCLIDRQVATLKVLAFKGCDGCVALLGIAHGDKAESAGTTGFTIGDESDFCRLAVLGEEIAEILISGVKGKITYVEFHVMYFFGDEFC
jgi:hypothetical protein